MKKVFIDTNVVIDLLLKREGYLSAAKVLSLSQNKEFSLFVSVLTMANIAYILRKVLHGDALYENLYQISSIMHVESITTDNYHSALHLRARDFEDALQYFCAKSIGCDVLVTRNEKDFAFSEIEVLSPSDFLSSL
jgi:predicted nucleic acid-binding protein